MRQPAVDGAARGHHGLSDHLPAEYPLPARLRAVAAKQVHLERFEVENGNEVDQSLGHRNTFSFLVMRGFGKASKFHPSGCENRSISGPRGPGNAQSPFFRPPVSPSYSEVASVRVSRSSMSVQRSIVIGGGAFAGLALAVALRQGLGADTPVIVADPALATRPSRDPRATAIVAACRRLFETLGAWPQVAPTAQPI